MGFGTSKYWVRFLVAHCQGSCDLEVVGGGVLGAENVVVRRERGD